MLKKMIITVPIILCSFNHASVSAQSIEELQAGIKSMAGCGKSLEHVDCNLQILDKDIQQTLIELEQLNELKNTSVGDNSQFFHSQDAVQFFSATIIEVDREIIKFMSGSLWRLDRSYFGLVLDDAIGLMNDGQNATIYANGDSYNARLVNGSESTSAGIVRTVVEEMGDGSVLRLDDGSLLEFSNYDRYETGWWLTPYKVLIDPSSMKMWNLDEAEVVWIQRFLK